MSCTQYNRPTDGEILDYFVLLELGAAGAEDEGPRPKEAAPRTAARRFRKARLGAKRFPRFFIAAALAGASIAAHAGTFGCISGTSGDCALATSTLSWDWNGTDFTIFNSGSGYVSEVYFDLGSGMSASFLGGTGTVSFAAGANPSALPGGSSVAFTSDASFDSDAPGGAQNGINNGESATFRFLAGSPDSIDTGVLTGGLHVRSLTTGGASLVTTPNVVTPVPEPDTVAMLLGGFALVAWATRARRNGGKP